MAPRTLAPVAIVGMVAIAGVIATNPYQQDRLTGFLNPGADSEGAGYQSQQAQIALGSGGTMGVGLGESVQKASYLPEAHTDMISAVLGEETGLAGMVVLIALLSLFGYAGFRAAHRARDRYGKLLAAGLTSLIMAQAAINLFAVLGLAPLTGVPLPFVSYGGTSLIVTLAAAGLIMNVARRQPVAASAKDRNSAVARRHLRPVRDCGRSRAGASGRGEGKLQARVVIAAGGTAGHVVPAIAVADALRASGASVSFIGTRDRAEAELVPAAGYEIDFIPVDGLSRRNPFKAAVAAARAAAAIGAAKRILSERDADAVLGGGGYVAGPVGLASSRLGIPLVLTEADSHLGLTNRRLVSRARAGLPRLPDRGARGRALPRHRAARAPGRARSRSRSGSPAVRHSARRPRHRRLRRQPRRPLGQRGRVRRVRRRRGGRRR